MSPTEVTAALKAAGRSDELNSVTSTLKHLMKGNRVSRPQRGQYLAT